MNDKGNQWFSFNPRGSELVITIPVREVKQLRRTLSGGYPVYTVYLIEEDVTGKDNYELDEKTYKTIKEWLEDD